MSKNSHVQRLPVEVDPFRLVEQGRIYEGRIPLSDFPRLSDLLFTSDSGSGEAKNSPHLVDVLLEFTRTETGYPVIQGKISTEMEMTCQRCLTAKQVSFETRLEVVLVSTDAEAERLQEGYDIWLVEDQRLFILDFIEDEILLALPLAIMHDACEPVTSDTYEASPVDMRGDAQELDDVAEKENPFAVLKDLKLS